MMHTLSLSKLRHLLDNREVSIFELTQYFLSRIERYNPELNAVLDFNRDLSLQRARFLEKEQKNHSPLYGIPILHKDLFCTTDFRTTCASKMLAEYHSPFDATVVRHLNDAGMVVLGKTNMDEFAMGSSNETSYFGACNNPWDISRVAGGSSGGSACAVAAGLTPVATGSDTGGSIRQPAAFCGISGIKPTYGSISRFGMVAFASSLDQAGPMAKSAEDLALMLDAMIRYDERDSTSIKRPEKKHLADLNNSIKGKVLGIPKHIFETGLDPAIEHAIEEAKQVYERLGMRIKIVELPYMKYSVPAYYILSSAECSSNLSRFDGVRFGYRCDNPSSLDDLYSRTRQQGFGDEVKRRILVGTYTLSAGYYDAFYMKAQKVRRLIKQDYMSAFDEVDLIMTPTTPKSAFIKRSVQDSVSMYLSDIYTTSVNLVGLPACSIPVGMNNGLPIGMQLIGNYFAESSILNCAHQYQQQTNWHQQLPEQFQ